MNLFVAFHEYSFHLQFYYYLNKGTELYYYRYVTYNYSWSSRCKKSSFISKQTGSFYGNHSKLITFRTVNFRKFILFIKIIDYNLETEHKFKCQLVKIRQRWPYGRDGQSKYFANTFTRWRCDGASLLRAAFWSNIWRTQGTKKTIKMS